MSQSLSEISLAIDVVGPLHCPMNRILWRTGDLRRFTVRRITQNPSANSACATSECARHISSRNRSDSLFSGHRLRQRFVPCGLVFACLHLATIGYGIKFVAFSKAHTHGAHALDMAIMALNDFDKTTPRVKRRACTTRQGGRLTGQGGNRATRLFFFRENVQ